MPNLNPEQETRENIDRMLAASGWAIQGPADEPASALLARIREERREAGKLNESKS